MNIVETGEGLKVIKSPGIKSAGGMCIVREQKKKTKRMNWLESWSLIPWGKLISRGCSSGENHKVGKRVFTCNCGVTEIVGKELDPQRGPHPKKRAGSKGEGRKIKDREKQPILALVPELKVGPERLHARVSKGKEGGHRGKNRRPSVLAEKTDSILLNLLTGPGVWKIFYKKVMAPSNGKKNAEPFISCWV